MLDAKLIERALKKTGKSKGVWRTPWACARVRFPEILSGIRLIKASEIGPITEYLVAQFGPDHGPGRRRGLDRAGA